MKDLKKIHSAESKNSRFGGEHCSSREKDGKSKHKIMRNTVDETAFECTV